MSRCRVLNWRSRLGRGGLRARPRAWTQEDGDQLRPTTTTTRTANVPQPATTGACGVRRPVRPAAGRRCFPSAGGRGRGARRPANRLSWLHPLSRQPGRGINNGQREPDAPQEQSGPQSPVFLLFRLCSLSSAVAVEGKPAAEPGAKGTSSRLAGRGPSVGDRPRRRRARHFLLLKDRALLCTRSEGPRGQPT